MAQHRLIAPRHLGPGHAIQLSDSGLSLTVPENGIVEIEDTPEFPGDAGNFEPRPTRANRRHLRELLALGFQHAPPAGGIAERPAGRYDGEEWFDTYIGKPLWWSNGAWRDALGRVV